jgi:hypothetical protein
VRRRLCSTNCEFVFPDAFLTFGRGVEQQDALGKINPLEVPNGNPVDRAQSLPYQNLQLL